MQFGCAVQFGVVVAGSVAALAAALAAAVAGLATVVLAVAAAALAAAAALVAGTVDTEVAETVAGLAEAAHAVPTDIWDPATADHKSNTARNEVTDLVAVDNNRADKIVALAMTRPCRAEVGRTADKVGEAAAADTVPN